MLTFFSAPVSAYVGLTALQSLSLVGCCMKVAFTDPERLRVLPRTSELEISGGVLIRYQLDSYLKHGSLSHDITQSEPVVPCPLPWTSHALVCVCIHQH